MVTQDILDELEEAAADYTEINDTFCDSVKFYGKTMHEWSEQLLIKLPSQDKLTPTEIKTIYLQLGNNLQQVTYFYTISNSLFNALNSGEGVKRNELIKQIIERYSAANAKRPAATAIEQMARAEMIHIANNRIIAKMLRDFWKEMRECIIDIKITLDQVTLVMSLEMKYLNG